MRNILISIVVLPCRCGLCRADGFVREWRVAIRYVFNDVERLRVAHSTSRLAAIAWAESWI